MQHWSRIEAFVEVVRLGTFSAAARHLKVSTSHISRLVSQLENQLGYNCSTAPPARSA